MFFYIMYHYLYAHYILGYQNRAGLLQKMDFHFHLVIFHRQSRQPYQIFGNIEVVLHGEVKHFRGANITLL